MSRYELTPLASLAPLVLLVLALVLLITAR